jgi:hypothetical protein
MAPVTTLPGDSHIHFKLTILEEGPAASEPGHLSWAEIMDTAVIQLSALGSDTVVQELLDGSPASSTWFHFEEQCSFQVFIFQIFLNFLRLTLIGSNSSYNSKCLPFHRVLVVHACNPSYQGKDQEDRGPKPTWANSSWDPILKNPPQKRASVVDQGVGPKFKL